MYAESGEAYNVEILYPKTAMGQPLFTRVCVCTGCVLQPFNVLQELMRHHEEDESAAVQTPALPIYSWILTRDLTQ